MLWRHLDCGWLVAWWNSNGSPGGTYSNNKCRNAVELSTVQIRYVLVSYGYSTTLELESTTVHLMTSVTGSLGKLVAVTVLSISGSRRQKDFRRISQEYVIMQLLLHKTNRFQKIFIDRSHLCRHGTSFLKRHFWMHLWRAQWNRSHLSFFQIRLIHVTGPWGKGAVKWM